MKTAKAAMMIVGMSMVPLTTGCMTMLAKMALGMATSKTADLSVCALQAKYISNLYPAEAGTFEMPYYTSAWNEGANIVTVSCTARNGAGLFSIDGTVELNGEAMEPMPGGTYSKVLPAGDISPKTVTIVTTTGQKAKFTVEGSKPITLTSVNGKSQDATVDVSKDLTLGFKDLPAEPSFVRVSVITAGTGMRNVSSIGTYPVAKSVKIPAAAFRHPALSVTSGMNVSSGDKTLAKSVSTSTELVTGRNYIIVERFAVKPLKVTGVPAAENVSLGWSWMPVDMNGKAEVVAGISSNEKVKGQGGEVEYFATKPNASIGKPLSKAKKLALVSLQIRGPLEVSTISGEVSSALETKRVDYNGLEVAGQGPQHHVWNFPKVPAEYWDSEMEKFRDEIAMMLQNDHGITLVNANQFAQAKSFQELNPATDEYTALKVHKFLKGTRPLAGSRVGSATFGSDQTEAQIMRELDVDGLLVVEVDFDLSTEKRKVNQLTSKIHYRIIARPNDYASRMNSFSEGQVATLTATPYELTEFTSADKMGRVTRRSDLIKGFGAALKDQESKAKELGYDMVWKGRPIDSSSNNRSLSDNF